MKILLSKSNQLGDNLQFLPVVQALASQVAPGNLAIFTSGTAADLYRGVLPDECIFAEPAAEVLTAWRRPFYFRQLLRQWRAFAPDVVFLPFDQGNVCHLLARLSGAWQRVGVANPRVRARRYLTQSLESNPVKPVALAEWEAGQRFTKLVGLTPSALAEPPPPDLSHLTQGARPVENRIMIHPGASTAVKRWPRERFIELANQLSQSHGVWFASDGYRDRALSDRVIRVPVLGLREYVYTLAGCSLFIGNNSGPMNLAAAVGVPSIIFSGPSPTQWDSFWNTDHTMNLRIGNLACQPCERVALRVEKCGNRSEPLACMNRWTVDDVLRRVHAVSWQTNYQRLTRESSWKS